MRNIQMKIVLIFALIGIVIMIGLAYIYINILNQTVDQVLLESTNSLQIIESQTQKVTIITGIAISIFTVISIIIGIFVLKVVVMPMTRLLKGAKKAATQKSDINENLKNADSVDELTESFNEIIEESNANLVEAKRRQKQTETILQHMTDGVILFNMDGKITYINPAAKELLDIRRNEDNFDKIFKKFNVDLNMEKIIYLEDWTSSERRINTEDKSIYILFEPFKDEKNRAAGIMVLAQDITEHVKLDNMRKEFVADVSHELKTPITSIMGYTETLLDSEYDKETQNRFLTVIDTEAKRMTKLVSDLLTLSKYDSKKTAVTPREFDLGELTKRCKEKLDIEIIKKRQKAQCLVTSDVPLVYADREGIERVILNILSNSIKYTPEGGEINIYVGFVYNNAYIKIKDNGIGIPKDELNRIFDRFYRVDKARTREMGGTGLGLSIAKEILDQNNGNIDIKSESNKGTEVVIKIPTKKIK